MRFAKPLDADLIKELVKSHQKVITTEENVIAGGAGSGVLELLSQEGLNTAITTLGLPDEFQDQATRNTLLEQAGLNAEKIIQAATR